MTPLPDNATIRLTCDSAPSQGALAIGGQIRDGILFTGVAVRNEATAATATLNLQTEKATTVGRMSSNPAASSTLVIGGTTYTFVSSLTTANQVLIGAGVAATLANLAAAINDSGGGGAIYGANTSANSNVTAGTYGTEYIILTAMVSGSAGTAFTAATGTGTTNTTWSSANLSLAYNPVIGDTVTIGAKTYLFKSTLTTANDVLIGATAIDSVRNLQYAVNDSGGTEGTHYGTGTTANASATALARTTEASIVFTAITSGTAGNDIVSTHTLPVGGFAGTNFANGAGASRLALSAMKDGDFVIAQFAIAMFSTMTPVGATVDYGRVQGYVRKGDYHDGTSFMLFTTPEGDTPITYVREDIIPVQYPENIANLIGYSYSKRELPVINVYASTRLEDTTHRFSVRETKEPELKAATRLEDIHRFSLRVVDDPLLPSASAESLLTGVNRFGMSISDPVIVTQFHEITGTNAFSMRAVDPPALRGGFLRLGAEIERWGWRHFGNVDIGPDIAGVNAFSMRVVEPPNLTGNEHLQAFTRLSWRHTGEILVEGIGMTLDSVILDCISHWGFTKLEKFAQTKFAYLQERIINDLNSVLQIIYSKAKVLDYFNREKKTFTVLQGSTAVTLPFEVQEVLGYIRRVADGVALVRVDSLVEIERFSSLYSPGGDAGLPLAYHIQRQTQEHFAWDVTRITLRVSPAPAAAAVQLYAECAIQAPRYEWNAVMTRTPLTLPHAYCESLLLPLLRHRCLTGEFADSVDQVRRQQMADEYRRAATTLQLVDPAPRKLTTTEKEAALAS